jgi:hypothetical protein
MSKTIIPENCRMAIKGLKTGPSMEYGDNGSYVCNVYFDNKKVARIFEAGNGGCLDIDITDAAKYKEMEAYFKDVVLPLNPPKPYDFDPSKSFQIDIDVFYSALVELFEENKQYKSWCRTKVCFSVKGDPDGEWRTLKGKYCQSAKDWIMNKYGDKVKEILNERFTPIPA